jgi:hypothetical protein
LPRLRFHLQECQEADQELLPVSNKRLRRSVATCITLVAEGMRQLFLRQRSIFKLSEILDCHAAYHAVRIAKRANDSLKRSSGSSQGERSYRASPYTRIVILKEPHSSGDELWFIALSQCPDCSIYRLAVNVFQHSQKGISARLAECRERFRRSIAMR